MKFTRRALAALLIAASTASLAAYPEKPIRVVIGFPAGGPLDQHARLLSEKLQAVLGQPVIIDYKAGAGGTVGAMEVMKAAPDGYTLMLANTGVMVINPALYSKLAYQTTRDFTPIARTAMQPLALLVNPKLPVSSLKEFIDYARTRPGQVNYGSAGNGGISHLVPEMFKSATGLFMVHIPYRGSAPAFTDLIGGQVQFMAESIPQAASYHKQGAREGAGRDQQGAQSRPARHAHGHRKRHPGLRGGRLLRLPRAGRAAQGRDGQAQRCLQAGDEQPRHPRQDGRAGRGPGLPRQRGLREIPRRRDAALGRRGEKIRRANGLIVHVPRCR